MENNSKEKDGLAILIGYGIIILGSISSLYVGNVFDSYEANWTLAISGIIASALFGGIFLFIGELLYIGYVNKDEINQLNNRLDKILPEDKSDKTEITENEDTSN